MRHLLMSNLLASKVHKIVLVLALTGEREFVDSHQTHKVISPLPQRSRRRVKRQNILSLRLVFTIKLFTMYCLLKNNFLVLCRFVSPLLITIVMSFLVLCLALLPGVGYYNLVSFLVLCLALSSATLQDNSLCSCALSCFFSRWSSLTFCLFVRALIRILSR